MKRLIIVIFAVALLCSGYSFDLNEGLDVYCDKCGSTNIGIDVAFGECDRDNELQAMSDYFSVRVESCLVYHGSMTTLTCLDCGYTVEKFG